MPDYLVFGGCLRSPLRFPELPDAGGALAPSWTIVSVSTNASVSSSVYLGQDRVASDVNVRLYRSGEAFRLVYDDTGTFDISPCGSRIRWNPGPDADPASARADILGCVLATAMHVSGRLCLHASAVVLPTGTLAFVAPKQHGKSTLAMVALSKGAKLLTDDCLPIEVGPPVTACPGVPGIRLWDDTRNLLNKTGATVEGAGGKRMLTGLTPECLMLEPQPLRAVYLLAPCRPEQGVAPVRRKRLSTVSSAIQLVRHARIGPLLGKSEAPVLLERATTLARQVPVYVLYLVRDFDRLDAAVEQLLCWHRG